MKIRFLVGTTAFLSASAMFGQNPTWAEQLHKTKTGIWPPGVEKRLRQEKQAREQKERQQQFSEALRVMDKNQDGVLSAEERNPADQKASEGSLKR